MITLKSGTMEIHDRNGDLFVSLGEKFAPEVRVQAQQSG